MKTNAVMKWTDEEDMICTECGKPLLFGQAISRTISGKKDNRHCRHLAHDDAGSVKPFPFLILPPTNPNVCQECGRDHTPEEPHDPQQLQYKYYFYSKNNRWPTWTDAMAHCSAEVKEKWIKELVEFGIIVENKVQKDKA
jgi:hypothetical protein